MRSMVTPRGNDIPSLRSREQGGDAARRRLRIRDEKDRSPGKNDCLRKSESEGLAIESDMGVSLTDSYRGAIADATSFGEWTRENESWLGNVFVPAQRDDPVLARETNGGSF